MAYWTPLDLEQVFAGWDRVEDTTVELEIDGRLLQVQPLGDGKAKIIRMISANPNDFLRPELSPGELVAII